MSLMRSLAVLAAFLVVTPAFARSHKDKKKKDDGFKLMTTPSTPTPATPPPPPAPSALKGNNGSLTVNCTTPGAEIFVDGEKVATSPVTSVLQFPPGEHTIKVQKPGFGPLNDVFVITKKKDTKLDVELIPISGVARVTANVEKARVFVDGKFICEAPCVADLGVGARAVQVSKGGFKDFFENVSAVAGQEIPLDVKLEELPMGLNPYKPPPPPPPKWFEKWWVWTAIAGGVVVVVVAVSVPVAISQQDPVANFGAAYTFTIKF
jgi:hypothetical protein